MSIPTMRTIIPPPPPKNKNKFWDRYAKGEVLKPTYEKQGCKIYMNKIIKSEPIGIKETDIKTEPHILISILIAAIIIISLMYNLQ